MADARGGVAPGNRRVRVRGTVRPPGDKSISHRALIVGALARGKGSSEFTGLLTGEDVKSTARVLRQLGAKISSLRDGGTVVVRASRFTPPASLLNCGNSGTTARLSRRARGTGFPSAPYGDASLRRRPGAVTDPSGDCSRIRNSSRSLPLSSGGALRSHLSTPSQARRSRARCSSRD